MAEKESQSSSKSTLSTTLCGNSAYVSKAKECLPLNPFTLKANSSSNSNDEVTKPLISPSTLGQNESDCSLSSKAVLRPSRLGVQMEKLEHCASFDEDLKNENNKPMISNENPFLESNVSPPQLFSQFVVKGNHSRDVNNEGTKPLVPSPLKQNDLDSSPKMVLRPSRFAIQTEKSEHCKSFDAKNEDEQTIIKENPFLESKSNVSSSRLFFSFGVKTNNSSDTVDGLTKPLIASTTLKQNDSDSSSSKVFLRPSRLGVQSEKSEYGDNFDDDTKNEIEQTIIKENPFSENKNVSTPQLFSPFSIKTKSSSDAGDEVTKPLIAPSALKLNDSDSIMGQKSSVSSKVILRPSLLAVQTEKLDLCTSFDVDTKRESENNKQTVLKENPFIENKNVSTSQLFVPISTSATNLFSTSKESDSSPSKSEESSVGFVFGQNLHERAANYENKFSNEALSHELTFEEAAQKSGESKENEQQKDDEATKRSLSESAKEYESKQAKRKYDEISVITGEEGESNALQITCKLFEFHMDDKSWQERGKGVLRLNDQMNDGILSSRVVMRTQGNLRVVLNTKVWPGMTVQHPSEKKVQLSAIHSDGVRVYLVMARPKDARQLYSALECRVSALKSKNETGNGDSNIGENSLLSSESEIVSDNHSLNGNLSKKPRIDTDESIDSVDKSDSGEGDVSSDSTKENYTYT